MQISPLDSITGFCSHRIKDTDYSIILEKIGFTPNVKKYADNDSWAFEINEKPCSIWAYHSPDITKNRDWSFNGSKEIAIMLFGEDKII